MMSATLQNGKAHMAKKRVGFSEFLHRRRNVLGRRWKDILTDAYLSRATLHRIRNYDPRHPIAEANSQRALAHALKFNSWAELVRAYEKGDPTAGLEPPNGAPPPLPPASVAEPAEREEEPPVGEDAVVTLSKALNLTPTELVRRLNLSATSTPATAAPAPRLPSSLRIDLRRPARLVPHFVSGVAASKRVEKVEDEDEESKLPVSIEDARAFSVPVDGDCQEPVWNNGDVVVFSFDAFDREGILPGKSYYLAFVDGSTTFKRVFLDDNDPEVYILRCWNTRKYPAERRVHFNEVVRIARAMSKQVTPEE